MAVAAPLNPDTAALLGRDHRHEIVTATHNGNVLERKPGGNDVPGSETPADLNIIVRDRRFGRNAVKGRWWLDQDPVATAFYNALSVTFPKGEAFFIESVKAFRDGASPRLAEEIRAFVKQEINHTREHVAFNRAVVDAGYDVSRLEKRVDEVLDFVRSRPAIINLAATMALEHYTAIIAQEALKNPRHFAGAEQESGDLWRWHAIEEIEHKGVAYDTYLHATRDWSAFKRWRLRSIMMLLVTINFTRHRTAGMLDLMAQDGLSGPKAWWRLAKYAFGRPGMVRRIILPWAAYFKPGFHPWDHDDRHLIALNDSPYRDAVMPKA